MKDHVTAHLHHATLSHFKYSHVFLQNSKNDNFVPFSSYTAALSSQNMNQTSTKFLLNPI